MSYSIENRLILSCINASEGDKALDQIPDFLRHGLAWDYIVRIVQQSGISPLFYYHIKKYGLADRIPVQVLKALESDYYRNGMRNGVLYRELKDLLFRIEGAGIKVIVLKGAVLAARVWSNIALRVMSDIDILVREEDLEKTEEILFDHGYIHREGFRPREWYRTKHHHLAPFYNPQSKVLVEVHRHVIPPDGPIDIEIKNLWERAQHIELGDIYTYALSREDQIIHICLHISLRKRFIGTVKDLADIMQIIARYGKHINWNLIITEARAYDFSDCVYYPLSLAKEALYAPINEDVLEEFKKGSKISFLNDRLLKIIIKNNILLRGDALSVFPQWLLKSLCGKLLLNISFFEKITFVLKGGTDTVDGTKDENDFIASQKPSNDFQRFFHTGRIFFLRTFRILSKIMKLLFHKKKEKFTH